MTGEQKSRITSLRQNGCGYAAIAKATNISVNTIKSFCRRNGLAGALVDGTASFCPHCGKVLEQSPKVKPKRFCSESCRRAWWKAHPEASVRKAYYEKTCANCKKTYSVYGRPNSKYCCLECAHRHRAQKAKADA